MSERIAPYADILILLGALIVIGGGVSLLLIKVAEHRRENKRRKVSKSRRGADTKVNLVATTDGAGAEPSKSHSSKRRRRRSRSSSYRIDILKKDHGHEEEPTNTPAPDAGPSQ